MQIWSEYGKKAEYLVANHLLSKGLKVRVSKNSRGVDIFAWNDTTRFCIQVKATIKSAHINAREIIRLQKIAKINDAKALIAIVRINDAIELYDINGWKMFDSKTIKTHLNNKTHG